MSLLMRNLFRRLQDEAGDGTEGGAASDPVEDTSIDWADLNDGVEAGADDDGEDTAPEEDAQTSEEEEQAGNEPPVKKPVKSAPKTPVKAAPAETSGEDTTTDEEQQEESAAPAEDQPVTHQPLTPEQVAERKAAYAKWEGEQLTALEKKYAFDEDTAAQLQTEPEVVLPKLAARLFMDLQRSVLEGMQTIVPTIVAQHGQFSQREQKANDAFYSVHPDLKPYHTQVLQAGQMFRAMNPKATPEQAIKAIGNLVRTSMGLDAPATQGKKPTGQKSAPARPHKPIAAGGGSPGQAKAPPASNPFADLVDDD